MSIFIKPAPIPPLISLLQAAWSFYAPVSKSKLRLVVSDEHRSILRSLRGSPAILCPNHPHYDDPLVLFGLSSILHEQFTYLVAREVFKDGLEALFWQAAGCYSILRGSCDVEAYKASICLLENGSQKIVIFPEGEITHQNSRILHFENGPEKIALSAARNLLKNNIDAPVYLIPLTILYRFEHDIERTLLEIISEVETALRLPENTAPLASRLAHCFATLTDSALKMKAWKAREGSTLGERMRLWRQKTIDEIAACEDFPLNGKHSQLVQLHALQSHFEQARFRQGKWSDPEAHRMYEELKKMTDIFAISDESFQANLSQEEAAELVTLLQEEVCNRLSLSEPQTAYVAVGKPIDVRDYLQLYASSGRHEAVNALRSELHKRVSETLTELLIAHPTIRIFSDNVSDQRITQP